MAQMDKQCPVECILSSTAQFRVAHSIFLVPGHTGGRDMTSQSTSGDVTEQKYTYLRLSALRIRINTSVYTHKSHITIIKLIV